MARPKKVKEEQVTEQQENLFAAALDAADTNTSPKPKTKIRAKMAGGKFDLFANDNIVAEQKDLMAKAGKAAAFKSIDEVNRECLPVPWFAFQYLIGKIGFTANTFNEIIGQECVGKSSLMIALACNFIKHGIPTYYINTEPKMLEGSWLPRLAGRDKALGKKILERLVTTQCSTYDDMDQSVRAWIQTMRGDMAIPLETPLVIIVDSITNLMSPDEAETQAVSAKEKDFTKALNKGVADVGQRPAAAAQWMSKWCRMFSENLRKFNVTMLMVSGQSTKMNSGTMTTMMADGGDSLNGERIGGKALKKDSAVRFTVTRSGFWKSSDQKTILGEEIRARMIKNSYGSKVADLKYRLRNKGWQDGPTTVDQAIDMDKALADVLVAENVYGFTVTRNRYTSTELGIEQADAHQLAELINNDETLQVKIGQALGINGYEAYDDDEEITE